jgi:hypothetical protein
MRSQTRQDVVVLASSNPQAWLTIGGPGRCGAVETVPLSVQFGVNAATGCVWAVSLADVVDCNSLRAKAAAVLLAAAAQPKLLGKYGNSDQLQPTADWIAVQGAGAPELATTPSVAPNVCPDVPTSLDLEILTAR